VTANREAFCQKHGINPAHTLVGLLPGSRQKEIASLLPDFLAAAKCFPQKYEQQFVFSCRLPPRFLKMICGKTALMPMLNVLIFI